MSADTELRPHRPAEHQPHRQVALVDLLDRLLGTGVVLAGDITVSLAGVDLVRIELHALIMSVRDTMEEDSGRSTFPTQPPRDGS